MEDTVTYNVTLVEDRKQYGLSYVCLSMIYAMALIRTRASILWDIEYSFLLRALGGEWGMEVVGLKS